MPRKDPDSIGRLKVINVKKKSRKEKIRILFVLGIAIFFGLAFFLTCEYRVTRFGFLETESKYLHAALDDLNQWQYWAPWIVDDPGKMVSLGEIESGVGASQSWSGKGGDGSMTITRSSPEYGIDFNLSLYDGMYQSKSSIHYQKVKGRIYVTWTEEGKVVMPVVGGYWALLMDPIAGSRLERGLNELKRVVAR